MADVPVRYVGMIHVPPPPQFADMFNDIINLWDTNGKIDGVKEHMDNIRSVWTGQLRLKEIGVHTATRILTVLNGVVYNLQQIPRLKNNARVVYMRTFLAGVVRSINQKEANGGFRNARACLGFVKNLIEAYAPPEPEELSIIQAVPEMDGIHAHSDITVGTLLLEMKDLLGR